MSCADATQVPAGGALAVDRVGFSKLVTEKISSHPNIEVINEEITSINENEYTVVATGPLTSGEFYDNIKSFFGDSYMHFFDAAAPIVTLDSIDMNVAFRAARYGKGDADYINCPMNEEQYNAFWEALVTAKEAELKEFDKEEQKNLKVFEGCMPVEVMARRGRDTLLFGPLKPVGLVDKRTGEKSHAVVQLRRENAEGTMYNLVGFQTHLTFPEQKRVFRMIPGLENAEFLRYGVMHRNTYLNSPELLLPSYRMKSRDNVYFAGQMTGVEGYIESAGSGFVAGLNAARAILGLEEMIFPREMMLGAMAHYVSEGGTSAFVPMNANFGIIAPLPMRVKGGKMAKYEVLAQRALEATAACVAKLY
jgi:methylenetetrahydrofolate--tRNA-(uracil-5-)-methyltransferase